MDRQDCQADHDTLISLVAQVNEYRIAIEQRLEKLNELRAQVSQDRQVYLRSDVYDAAHQELQRRVDKIQEDVSELSRWQARLIGVGLMMAVLMPLIAVILARILK